MSKDIIIKQEPLNDRTIHFLIPALSANEPSHILSLPEIFAVEQNPLEIPLPSGKYILAPSPSELFHYYESVQPQMNSIISASEGFIDHLTSEKFIHLVENLSEYSIPCPVLQSHVDKSTSMISIEEFDETISNRPMTDYYYEPDLFQHNEQTLPVTITSSNDNNWKTVRSSNKTRHTRKRTKFSNDDLEILNLFFEKNPMPSRSDISILSERLAYPRYIIQVWFYNKRQSLKRANSSSSR